MKELKTPKGTKDYLPEEMKKRRVVIEKFRRIFERYGYEEVCTPVFEYLELLEKKANLGEENVKDIYKFQDKGGRWLGLRFDMTTPIARIVASNPNLKKPIKWYYVANMWRYENPQRGRLREFWQAGIENLGLKDEVIDAEILAVTYDALREIGIDDFTLNINSRRLMDKICDYYKIKNRDEFYRLVDKKSKLKRVEWIERLKRFFKEESYFKNFLELMESSANEVWDKIPSLAKEELEYLEKIIDYAKEFGIGERYINPDLSIVRGLEYYTDFVFETYKKGEESLGSLASGGRYDNLIELYGGKKTPATGMAIGIDRVMEIVSKDISVQSSIDVLVCPVDDSFKKEAVRIASILRRNGIRCDVEIRRRLKNKLSYADSLGIKYCIIIGREESQRGVYSLRDMEKKEQYPANLNEIIKKVVRAS